MCCHFPYPVSPLEIRVFIPSLLRVGQVLSSFEVVDDVTRVVLKKGRRNRDFVGLDNLPETLVELRDAFVAFLLWVMGKTCVLVEREIHLRRS